MVNYVWQVSKKLRGVYYRLNPEFFSCAEAKSSVIGVRFAPSAYGTALVILSRQFDIRVLAAEVIVHVYFHGVCIVYIWCRTGFGRI